MSGITVRLRYQNAVRTQQSKIVAKTYVTCDILSVNISGFSAIVGEKW